MLLAPPSRLANCGLSVSVLLKILFAPGKMAAQTMAVFKLRDRRPTLFPQSGPGDIPGSTRGLSGKHSRLLIPDNVDSMRKTRTSSVLLAVVKYMLSRSTYDKDAEDRSHREK